MNAFSVYLREGCWQEVLFSKYSVAMRRSSRFVSQPVRDIGISPLKKNAGDTFTYLPR